MKTLNLVVLSARNSHTASRAQGILWCSLLLIALVPVAQSQSAPSSQVTPNNQTGVVSHNTFAGDHENVNLATGDLNVQIPLVSLPGRDRHDLNVSLLYDSRIYELKPNVDPFFGFTGYSWTAVDSGGWRFNFPFISKRQHCDPVGDFFDVYWGDFTVTLPDGSKHHFDNTAGHALHQTACDGPITNHPNGEGTGFTTDLSLRLDTPDTGSAVLHFRDGSSLVFYNYLSQPNQIDSKDSNGNIISYLYNSGNISSITDSLGRAVTIGYSSVPYGSGLATILPTSVSYTDSNGAQQTTTLGYTSQILSPTFSSPAGLTVASGPAPMLTTITIPTTRSYALQYNNFGEMTKITYPVGGYTRYAYGAVQGWYQLSTNSTSGDVRIVTNSYFCANASGSCTSTEEKPTTYAATRQAMNANNTAMTVTDALGNYTNYTFSDSGAIASGFTAGCDPPSPRELTRAIYDSGGHLLRSVSTDYNTVDCGYGPARMYPIRVTTTLDDGKVTKTEWDYDTFGATVVDNAIEERVFDYGNLNTPAVKHRTTYLKVNPVNNVDYPGALFILGQKASEQVLDSHSGTDVLVAQVTYEYDSYTAGITPSGATQHDSAFGTAYTTRANITAVNHWRNTDGAFLTTRNQYDDAGNVLSTTDPLNHTTQFSYADNFTGTANHNSRAYVTQVTYPPTNGVNHIERKQYFFNSGLLAASCGQNFPAGSTCANTYSPPQPDYATYLYDGMNRLVQLMLGDGGGKTITYNDIPPVSSTTSSPIASGLSPLTTVETRDGAGRTVQTALTSDSAGTDYVDTTYDALNRVASVSNPYRSSSDSTYGVTQFQYDALDRSVQVTNQDGSFSTLSYTGSCTTATDEADKQRRSCSDALGRLIEVDEPAGTAGTAASGGLTISGTLQSNQANSGTPGTGSVTVSGSEQSKAGAPATAGRVSITITGAELMTTTDPCNSPDQPPGLSCPQTTYDMGTATLIVNGHSEIVPYGQGDATSTIAGALVTAINGDSAAPVTASTSASILTLTSKATGAASNYSFSLSIATSDPTDFPGPSFGASPASGSLTGGTNAGPTVYDHGTCTVTINGTAYSKSYGQTDTLTSIASGLATTISAGTLANASASGGTISLTAKTSGASTNYSLTSSTSCSYDSTNFSRASFTTSASGSTLTGGTNGSPAVTDVGTVQMSVSGYAATANYGNGTGQDATASAVAADLVGKIQAQLPTTNPPFAIWASSATINLTWGSVGTAGNVNVATTSTTTQSATFPKPSFASCSITTNPQTCTTALSGGANPTPPSLSTPWVTLYQYDAFSNLLRVDQKGSAPNDSTKWRTRLFTYNSLSQLLTASNPELNSTGNTVTSYGYDNDGRVISKQEPAPNQTWGSAATVTINYSYDDLDRLLDTTYSDGVTLTASHRYDYASFQNQTFAYPIGREVAAFTMNSGGSNVASTYASYELMGRVAALTQCNPGVAACQTFSTGSLGTGYDKLGDLLKVIYPGNGFTMTYAYDSAAHIIKATDSNGVIYAQNPTYLAPGMLQEFTSPNFNNNKFHADYNNRLQPVEIWAGAGQGVSALFDKQYSYGTAGANNGNIFTITNVKDNTRTQAFTYDALNRLITAGDQTHWSNSYVYDAWGNLYQKNPGALPGENLVKVPDSNNHLSGLTYNAAGDVSNDGTGGVLVYDAENRIKTAGSVTYTYDAYGRRVQKSTGINYWYGIGGVMAETDPGGNWTNYIFFGGQRLARNIPQTPPVQADIKYYITDHLHSTGLFVDKAGTTAAILDDNDFYPWGGVIPGIGKTTSNNTIKFTGQYRDTDTSANLDYFGARYYSNSLGRFITPDWAANATAVPYAEFTDPQSLNLYSYVRNVPTSRSDPTGHSDVGHETNASKHRPPPPTPPGCSSTNQGGLPPCNPNRKKHRDPSPSKCVACHPICDEVCHAMATLRYYQVRRQMERAYLSWKSRGDGLIDHTGDDLANAVIFLKGGSLIRSIFGATAGKVVTGTNRYFWFGKGAEAAAEELGGETLQLSEAAVKALQAGDATLMEAESAAFAAAARGTVTVVVGDTGSLTLGSEVGRTFFNVELPALIDNPNVTGFKFVFAGRP